MMMTHFRFFFFCRIIDELLATIRIEIDALYDLAGVIAELDNIVSLAKVCLFIF